MKKFITLVSILTTVFLFGCEQTKNEDIVSHSGAILRYQDGQMRFKSLVGTVYDEESFDEARPKLAEIAADWHKVANALSGFKPPIEKDRQKFRNMLEEGNERAEPTAGAMISFVMVESRQEEILEWQEEFLTAASSVIAEFTRLYGEFGHSDQKIDISDLDISISTMNGIPLDQAIDSSAELSSDEDLAE